MAVKTIVLAWLFVGLLSMINVHMPRSVDNGASTVTYAQPVPAVHTRAQATFAVDKEEVSFSYAGSSTAGVDVPITLIPVGQEEGVIPLKLVWLGPDWFEGDTEEESPAPLYLGLLATSEEWVSPTRTARHVQALNVVYR